MPLAMKRDPRPSRCREWLLAAIAGSAAVMPAHAQLSPAEIGPAARMSATGCDMAMPAIFGRPSATAPAPMSALERMRLAQRGGSGLADVRRREGVDRQRFDLQPAIGASIAAQPVEASCPSADISVAAPARSFPLVAGAGDDSELGTQAIPIDRTRFDDRWDRVRASSPARLMRAQLRQAGVTGGLGERETLERINRWVNRRITYKPDSSRGVANDYWATAEQTISRGQGDCEDYAILKMQMLIAAGIAPDRVKLVLLRDLVANADHALLLVQSQDGKLVLDNMTDRLYDGRTSQDVRPILSFSGSRRWVHGYVEAKPLMLAAKAERPLF